MNHNSTEHTTEPGEFNQDYFLIGKAKSQQLKNDLVMKRRSSLEESPSNKSTNYSYFKSRVVKSGNETTSYCSKVSGDGSSIS
jgi:hypothetical protein